MRGQKVMLDADLAALYGVTTKRLNEQARRNADRFPPDFIFKLTKFNQEFTILRSQFATSSSDLDWGGRRSIPFAFTEHGALMAASVLNSSRAIEVSVYVVRAFVRLRETLAQHEHLAKDLAILERQMENLTLRHDRLAGDTRNQFRQVFEALRALMVTPQEAKRPIGFVTE